MRFLNPLTTPSDTPGATAKREVYSAVARRLLAREGGDEGNAQDRAAAAGRVYDSLHRSLAPVIGAAGVRAILARSVKLASAELPCLGRLTATDDGTEAPAQGALHLVSCLAGLEPAAASEVAISVYATLLGVMTKLIGEGLVLQIVKTAFPVIDQAASEEVE